MFNATTPIYSVYSSMVCQCAQCQQARNAPTAILPRLDNPVPINAFMAEMVIAIDSETGRKRVYYWPIQREY